MKKEEIEIVIAAIVEDELWQYYKNNKKLPRKAFEAISKSAAKRCVLHIAKT